PAVRGQPSPRTGARPPPGDPRRAATRDHPPRLLHRRLPRRPWPARSDAARVPGAWPRGRTVRAMRPCHSQSLGCRSRHVLVSALPARAGAPMSLLTVNGLARRYADRTIFRDVGFRVARGDRVGVIGPNGSGKSTLLRAIVAREADEGSIVLSKNTRLGFLEQELDPGAGTIRDLVDSARSRLDAMETELRSLEPRLSDPAALERYGEVQHAFEHAGGYDFEAQASRVLGGLGLGAIDSARALATLSGGERARASLAALLLSDPDLLLLDEPTNHLDLAALEWLETFLLEGERSLVVVSHDRYFLDRVTARTLVLDRGTLRAYRGGYSAYARESA